MQQAAAAEAAEATSKPTLRQRLDAGGAGEEAILQDPLQLHKVGAPLLCGCSNAGIRVWPAAAQQRAQCWCRWCAKPLLTPACPDCP